MLKRSKLLARFSEMRAGWARVFRHVAPHLRLQQRVAAGAGLAMLGATGLRLLEPWPLKILIDRVLASGPPASTGFAVLDEFQPMTLLLVCAGLVLLSVALRALCEYVATIGFALTGARVLARMRYQLFCHLQRLSPAFHDRTRAGDLTMRVVNDVASMREAMVTALLPFATNVLVLFSMCTVMLVIEWRLALVALAPLPLLAFTTVALGGRIQQVSREQRRRESSMASAASEVLSGIRSVQALSLESRMARMFDVGNAGSLADGIKGKRLSASLERSTDLLSGLSTAATMGFGGFLVLRGQLTAGDLVVFLSYLKNTFRPIRDFAKNASRIAKATAAGERIADVLEQQPQIRDAADAIAAPQLTGRIHFEKVGFRHADGRTVLDGFDCRIEARELVALVGRSGVGKSTVGSLLVRLYDPTAGAIRVDGHDLRKLTLASLRGQLALASQDPLLLADSVRENISLARPGASEDEVIAAAELAGAHSFITALPLGYDTLLSERGTSLSVGQRQRLMLARVALRASPIVILDEPTNALDPDNEALVVAAIRRLAERSTVLLITHDMALAASADRVLVLADGRVVEQGRPEALLGRDGPFSRLHADRSMSADGGRRAQRC